MSNVIDVDLSSLTDWDGYIRDLKEYLQCAQDPNEVSTTGKSLLNLSLLLASRPKGQTIVAELLRRGADPNYPSALANFTALLTICNSIRRQKGSGVFFSKTPDPFSAPVARAHRRAIRVCDKYWTRPRLSPYKLIQAIVAIRPQLEVQSP